MSVRITIAFACIALLTAFRAAPTLAQAAADDNNGQRAFTADQFQNQLDELAHDLDDPNYDYSHVPDRIRALSQDMNAVAQDMDPGSAWNFRHQMSSQLQAIVQKHQAKVNAATQFARIKDLQRPLGCSDPEFAALAPFLSKVLQAIDAASTGQPGGFIIHGVHPGQRLNITLPPLPQATFNLQMALDDQSSTADSIESKVEALRLARGKAADDLKYARDQLRALVTPRQEASLVAEGLLD
jgi:hypothetical protein